MIWRLFLVVCVVTVCYSKSIKPKQTTKLPFTLDDFLLNRFGASGFGGTWISGNEFTYTSGGSFIKYNVETMQNTTILPKEFIDLKTDWVRATFRFSPDLTKILVRYSTRAIFRHSTVSKFSVIKYPEINEPEFKIADGGEIQIAFFAPSGNGLAYIEKNNIFYKNLDDESELLKQITADGVEGVVYNGIPDWVYEEEVLGTDAATWISPDGKFMAFVRFNDTNVQEAHYAMYGNDGERQYPLEISLRYPKAGTTNPTVALFIVELANPDNRQEVVVPIDKVSEDHILGTVFWINDETVGAIWMNRRQNRGVFVSYDTTTFAMAEIMEINEPTGWINVNTPKCDANSVCYFINNHDKWPALISVDTKDDKLVTPLTNVGMNVLSFYGIYDGTPYFLSTPKANESFNRHVYAGAECLTCEIRTPEGNVCTYASVSFSRDLSNYVMTCSGPDPAIVKIYKTTGPEEISTWVDNAALRTSLQNRDLPQTKIFHVPVGGFDAVVKMQLPNHIDFEKNESADKYPMLIRVYAGPGSVRVSSAFGVGYQTYQTSAKDIIYVEIDGRGAGQNGNDMMFSVNNRLGTYEVEDQLTVTKFLVDKYSFIDPARVAIWGWSYGGYATAMTLAKDPNNIMKCGISVAPVTSWRFYDTIYTERYMGIDSNATNYADSAVYKKEYVENIGKHQFFLIHGNADDNVHYQQSMVLARELELADIIFDQLSYPDEAHAISGTQRHLYHAMDIFWDKCFKK